MAWQIDEDIPLTATFANLDGNLYDPTTVTLEYKNPVTETVTEFTWTESVPGADIVRLSLGTFRAVIRASHKGYWHWKWVGDGSPKRIIQSDDATAIEVEANVF